MKVAEIYQSVQGEGLFTGTQSVFIRASGCNLRCWYCDTPYASWSPEGEDLDADEIIEEVERFEAKHVVLTGGEPMLFAEIMPLCTTLRRRGQHITIETAGTLYLPVECDLMSISPKLSNSAPSAVGQARWHERHQRSRHVPDVIRRLVDEHDYQIKFVVNVPEDCDEIESYLGEFPEIERSRVMLMPQGSEQKLLELTATWLAPYCRDHNLQFCPRRQIEWFGSIRGT